MYHPTGNNYTERFKLEETTGGWRIVLTAPVEEHPLLLEMAEGDTEAVTGEINAPSIHAAVGLLMARAALHNLVIEPKGRLDNPLLVLSRRPVLAPSDSELQPFAALGGRYASHWGLSDFYAEYRAALTNALAQGVPFDTGWFGAKKEIEYGRIRVNQADGTIEVSVTCEADDGVALADTAYWKAAGGNAFAGSGAEALERCGAGEEQVDALLERLAQEAGIGETNSVSLQGRIPAGSGLDQVCAELDRLTSKASEELEQRFERMVLLAADILKETGYGI